jgi:hypothetical protein
MYLVLFIPWGIAIVMGWGWRIRWRSVWVMASAAGVVFLPQYIYSQTNPAPTLNHAFVEGWTAANAFQSSFTTVEGQFEYQQINALFYAQPFYEADYLSPLFTPLLIMGGWLIIRRKEREIQINHRGTEGGGNKAFEPQRRGGRRDQREKRFIYRADTEKRRED